MPKLLLAVVRDENGITVELRACTIPDLQALSMQADAVVDVLATLDDPAPTALCAGMAVGANGQILSVLAAMIQKAAAALPIILPYILQLLPLFASKDSADSTAVGEACGANGQILNALAAFLQMAATELPIIVPEILQLIAAFGGKVSVAPATSTN